MKRRSSSRKLRDTMSGRQVPRIKADESPLAWLASRKDKDGQPLISHQQFEAGERLRRDFTFAMLAPRVTASYSALPSGRSSQRSPSNHAADMADSTAAARERVNRALAAVGPGLSGILLDVCCYLKGLEVFEKSARWPQRSAKIVLAIALDQLALHYGMRREPGTRADQPVAIRHWGAAGYRPVMDAGGDGEDAA